MAIKFDKGSHWYGRDGAPRHSADLRVARKELLYPSVTSLDKLVFKNEFLDNWKIEQVVLAAVQHPKQPHEDDETYSNRIYQLSLDKPRDAADFGTTIHDAIEKYPAQPTSELLPWFSRYHDWHQSNILEVIASEKIVVDHDIGVAGKCDRIAILKDGRTAVIDYKTQGIKLDDKGNKKAPQYYESWPRQLAFYAVSLAKETKTFPDSIPACVSLVFDSLSPETPLGVKFWDPGEIKFSYRQFCCGAYLWFAGNTKRKAYWPTGKPWQPEFNLPMPL